QRGVDIAGRRLHLDRPDPVLLPLLYDERDHEAAPSRIVLSQGGNDADVDESVLKIEPAQQFAVGLDPIGIVDVAGLQECKQPGFRCLDYFFEAVGRVRAIPHKFDQLHARLRAFADLEDEIDTIVGQLDDLGYDSYVEPTAAAIHFNQTGDIRLHDSAGKRA